MSDKPFALRSPNGQNAGLYLVTADYQGAKWTDDVKAAARFSMEDAYGNVAACIDMLCQCVVPENVGGATEELCREFGRLAARDMLQSAQPSTIDLFEKFSVRRATEQPLYELPAEFPKSPGYMSVFEWMGRAFYRGQSVAATASVSEPAAT